MQTLTQRNRWRVWLLGLVGLATFALPDVSTAQRIKNSKNRASDTNEDAEERNVPLVTVSFAGIERLLQDADFMFEAAGRPEMADVVTSWLGNANDLKGMARNKPFGIMVFLEPGLIPRPVPVGYFPVLDIKQLLQTVATAPVVVKPVPNEPSRYEIEIQNSDESFQVRHEGGYAFVTNDENSTVLDRPLTAPLTVAQSLASRYDVGASLTLGSVPSAMKAAFLIFLETNIETELQQRDDEPESRYRVRAAQGRETLEFLKLLLTEGEEITLGWDSSSKDRKVKGEFFIRAAEDSKLAKYFKDIAGEPSRYAHLLNDRAPLSISVSWMLAKATRLTLTEGVNAAEVEVSNRVPALAGSPKIAGAFEALRKTVAAGHLDMYFEFKPQPEEGGFAMLAAIGVQNGQQLAAGVVDVLNKLPEPPSGLTINVARHAGVAFHKVERSSTRTADERVYGGRPAVFFGAGSRTIWIAVGKGDYLPPALRQAMDSMANVKPRVGTKKRRSPFELSLNVTEWFPTMREGGRTDRLFKDAFQPGRDTLTAEFRPTDDGMRMTINMQEGFVRFIGMSFAQQFDRMSELRERRERRRREREEKKRESER